ncbi:Kinetochore protein-like protein [Hapsidospora chrysogenum ATCC 11550]|uniref:Kinetochore protein-like protein n=1 Tax=Hapsidospora chrysogenum (strain ATCC 11550 / CBS 779.69 / DSM 880 / IAM 14645 / JCM 23072 / IMI 49137) TaxID=857340 RepID=A0A086TAX0_HAPC1|nr:Kinetochore protein-like protein [Hapsidospora chrysogenum ATCC 11550]
MDAAKTTKVLQSLEDLQSREISIVKLSEPIASSASQDGATHQQRTSGASNASLDADAPTPASLEADLAHYKELFAKLRFSYVEQVTKEKFIRAIVGDPPLIVTMQENLDLEKENAAAKSELKALKLEVSDMVAELETRARELSRRYEGVRLDTARLRDLPGKLAELEDRIAELKAERELSDVDPNLNLPLAKTQEIVARRTREQQELARELEALRAKVPRKRKEAERLQAELQPLETKRQNGMAAAKEAQRRKEASLGGVADDLEQRARWWRASESVLKQTLDLEGVKPCARRAVYEGNGLRA